MGWTAKSRGKGNTFKIYTETIQSRQGAMRWTSEIDFIPPGTDFQVISNISASDLSASTHVELFVAYDSSAAVANRYRRTDSGFNPVTTEIDNATAVNMVDVSSHGQFPYYYLKLPQGAGGGDTVTFAIVIGDKVSE